MSDTAILVNQLGKRYRLGGQEAPYRTIRETILETARAPFQWMKRGRKDLAEFWALDDISLQIKAGEAVGIIGRNGAGKSTLLKILSRITRPTRGRAEMYGRVGSLLEVGTGFHPELSGRENIYLNGAILGMQRTEIDRKFGEIVAFAETEKFLDTPVKFYSSGMYVRLAFAVAAHLESEILLMDEVLAVGDAAFQKKCLGKMGDVAKEGRTILFVSHNMSAINRLCSRAVLLDEGKLVADGPAPEITAKYLGGADGEESGTRAWDMDEAPGNDDLKLVSLMLLNDAGTPVSVVDVRDRLKVRLVYHVGTPNLRFRCLVLFFTQGVLAFAAVEPAEEVRETPGNYFSTVTIPPHLLGECEYVIGVSIFTSSGGKKHFVKLNDVLVFQVYDSMTGPSARGDYAQNLAGVVRPMLSWEKGREIQE
jgi:lipopolysaccharide transport system ATP-binding protein